MKDPNLVWTRYAVEMTLDLEAIRARNDAARQMVSDLCRGNREWIMHIPVQRDNDPVYVIGDSLRDGVKLMLAYESVKEQASALASDLAAARTQIETLQAELRQAELERNTLLSFGFGFAGRPDFIGER